MNIQGINTRRPVPTAAGSLACFLLCAAFANGATTNLLLPSGSLWNYLDDGSNQGTAWRSPSFDDSAWPEGFAQLGYGDSDEETVLYSGPINDRFITCYFRTTFALTGAATYTNLTIGLLRDDGAVVYLNGTEVWRNNMPAGPVTFISRATTNVNGVAAENAFITASFPPTLLVNGVNHLAVEVHQVGPTSADLSFDLVLSGISAPPVVTRGPYLQRRGTTNMTVRWRTNVPSDSEVRFGSVVSALSAAAYNATVTTNHEVVLTGLLPDTRYFYSIGIPGASLAGNNSHVFSTAPAVSKPTRIWAIGDAGTANISQISVYNAYRNFAGQQAPDVWLMLGDNAYGSGTDAEYQAAMFNIYPEFLRQTVAWSTIGNHETYAPGATPNDFPFLRIFTQPTAGECGGVPSGTEKYYSFDHGDIHFICLDANFYSSNTSSNGSMRQWLEQDLAANTNLWLIAFWHHPPYTKGSHDSDFEAELISMRQNIVPVLESYGVDLVLSGHSHSYERSFLIDGHYGSSGTLSASMKKDAGSGREDGTGPYIKPTVGLGANRGAIYVVAGSSGGVSGGSLDHPVMYYDASQLGSFVIDIDGPELRAYFLRETGVVDDYFTLIKGGVPEQLRIGSHTLVNGVLTLSWASRADRRFYRIERATMLWPADWTTVATNLEGTGAVLNWSTAVSGSLPHAFFRVVQYID